MSNIPVKDANDTTHKVDVFLRTEGADQVEMQAMVPVDPASGAPIDFATETSLVALIAAAEAIQSAAEALNAKAIAINTGAVGGTVSVSNMVAAGLTDTQLRASAVPVSGSFWQATQPVSGPLTDTQLRATDVPVGGTILSAVQTFLATLAGTIQSHNAPFLDGAAGQLILGKRRDSDSTTVADGDYNTFNMDEEGRLKVASKPASYADITGTITAVQPTIGTPVAGGTVSGDVSRASNLMAFCTGTFAGANVTFEGSLEATGETNWFGVQAVRSNANTIETSTGALSAAPAYAWELSVNALSRVRVRSTALTSGSQAWRFKLGTYATEPIPAAQVTATQPVSGTVTATVTAGTVSPVVPATPYFLNSLATTNIGLVLTGTSGVHALYATNTGASVAYIKLYNKATAPALATDVPEMIIPVPAAVSGVPGVAELKPGFAAYRFALGLGIAITGGAADTDTTAVAAGQVKVKISRTV